MQTDHPDKAKLTLTVIANVVVDNDLESKNIRFAGAEIGKESMVKIPFLSKDPSSLSFGKVTSSKDDVTAAMVKDGAGWSLEAKLVPTVAGHSTAKIDIEMLAPEKKTIVVFASAKVAGDIRVIPDVVSIHRKPGTEVPDRQVRLRSDKGSFEVEKVESGSEDVKVEITEETPGEVYLLTVGLTEKGLAKQAFNTEIKVHTSSKVQPVIEIPVRVRVLAPQGAAGIVK